MNFIISILIGAMVSLMSMFNGTLSNTYGNYTSSIIIHVVGLLLVITIMLIKKAKVSIKKNIPIYLFSAGAVGVFTVVFTNISFVKLGALLTMAIGLLGQSLISIIVDHFGILGMKENKFKQKKLIGLSIIIMGIFVMISY